MGPRRGRRLTQPTGWCAGMIRRMKRTIMAAVVAASVLALGACSSTDDDDAASAPKAELGTTQTVKGADWEAEVTVADLITREMDYYGDIKPERQYRAAVTVKSVSGDTPLASNAFTATVADGSSLTISIGSDSDDIQPGDVPAGQQRSGMVTWTGQPGLQVKEIEFVPDGLFSVATWTTSAAPEAAAPSRMPNHDEVVATKTPAAAPTTSAVAASTVEAPVTQAPVATTMQQIEPTYEAPAAPVTKAPVGFTGAPNGAPAPLTGKVVDHCLGAPMYQTGTTVFTDGTTGWTEQCAYGG